MPYTKLTDFSVKDALATGNPSKIIKGTEIDDEFDAISTAFNGYTPTTTFAASSGSTLMGWIRIATGAVARLVSDKLAERVSINDFGGGSAKTSAQNTTAFQAAMTAGVSIIEFPDANYNFTTFAINTNSVELRGTGTLATTLTPDAVAVDAIVVSGTASCQSFTMRNIHLVGNATSTGGVVLGSASYNAPGVNFLSTYISGFTAVGASGLRLVNTWWINVTENSHFYASYYNIHIPAAGIVTTFLMDDNAKLRSATRHNFFNEATVMSNVDKLSFMHCSMEDSAYAAIKGTSPGTTYLFDDTYFEVNCSNAAATACIDITSSDATTYRHAIVIIEGVKFHTTLNSKPDLLLGYAQRSRVSNCDGLNTITTSATSEVKFSNMRGNSAGDPLTLYKTLLGSIQAEEYDTATGYISRYTSAKQYVIGDELFYDSHIGTKQTTAPTTFVGGGIGVGGTPSVSVTSQSTDNAGKITIVKGTSGWTATGMAQVAFNRAYSVAPYIVITPGNDIAAAMVSRCQLYVDVFTGSFFITALVADNAAGTAIFYYHVIGD